MIEQTQDVGNILRELRQNHGWTIEQVSKKISLHPQKISRIERSAIDLPPEHTLRLWLEKLGCDKTATRNILNLARLHRVVHTIRLRGKDQSNADMIRIINAYRDETLTPFDRDMLSLIANA